jgi:hypothetical protein
MTVRVIIVENPLDSRDWEDFEVEAAIPFMMKHFRTWPGGARIYDMDGVGLDSLLRAGELLTGNGLAARDVTPRDEAGVDRLGTLNGPLVVAVAPADPITAIIAVVAVIVAVVATLLLMPKMPTVNNSQPSANNTLAGRSNTARPGSRIEDIFGTVRSIPSLLQVPYRTFLNNLELEIAYMCVGRGSYDLADVRDGDTALSAIAGAAAHFYGPDTSPNFGDTQLSIGTPIDDPVLSVSKVEAVNGQILRPPNANFIKGDGDIRFVAPDTIQRLGGYRDLRRRSHRFEAGQFQLSRYRDAGRPLRHLYRPIGDDEPDRPVEPGDRQSVVGQYRRARRCNNLCEPVSVDQRRAMGRSLRLRPRQPRSRLCQLRRPERSVRGQQEGETVLPDRNRIGRDHAD